MKTYRLLLAGLVALCLVLASTGCSTPGEPSKIQQALDAALPPDFTGPADFGHKNVYFDFDVRATGLRRTEAGWTWTSLSYRRNGRFSTGWINLGPKT